MASEPFRILFLDYQFGPDFYANLASYLPLARHHWRPPLRCIELIFFAKIALDPVGAFLFGAAGSPVTTTVAPGIS